MQSLNSKKRVRHDSDESVAESVEAKRILLDILDESDVCTVTQDLDSFIKTFQDEISPPLEIITSESAQSTESRQELGFLLEASDDELGLPPTSSTGFEKTRGLAESVELGELWGLDDQISNYGSFEYEFGYGDVNISSYNNGEYEALDALFDHTDLGFGSSELSWQPETLPAQ